MPIKCVQCASGHICDMKTRISVSRIRMNVFFLNKQKSDEVLGGLLGPRGGAVGPRAVVPVLCRTWRETQYRDGSSTLQSIARHCISHPLVHNTNLHSGPLCILVDSGCTA